MSGPYFILCAARDCERIAHVRSPYEQRTRRFCSRACASRTTRHLTHADQLKGAEASKVRRRAKALAKLAGLSPVEVFWKGYSQGWHQGARSARRRMGKQAA